MFRFNRAKPHAEVGDHVCAQVRGPERDPLQATGRTPRRANITLKATCLAMAGLTAGLMAWNAQAQTATPVSDDLDKFIAEKGLLTQIGEVGHKVTHGVTEKASELVVAAMGFLGVPYKRGGNTFDGGFDCSGFVKALFEQSAGLLLPRKAEQQAAATVEIDKAELQPGDLVFFNTLKKAFSHVGIYVGDGKFIHSPRAGSAVRVEDMQKTYWNQRFDGARRVHNSQN